MLVFIASLYGCNKNDGRNRDKALNNLDNYRCSQEQLDLVEKEMSLCREGNIDYECYSWAKSSQCTFVDKRHFNDDNTAITIFKREVLDDLLPEHPGSELSIIQIYPGRKSDYMVMYEIKDGESK